MKVVLGASGWRNTEKLYYCLRTPVKPEECWTRNGLCVCDSKNNQKVVAYRLHIVVWRETNLTPFRFAIFAIIVKLFSDFFLKQFLSVNSVAMSVTVCVCVWVVYTVFDLTWLHEPICRYICARASINHIMTKRFTERRKKKKKRKSIRMWLSLTCLLVSHYYYYYRSCTTLLQLIYNSV